jgi:hypothetical protein
LSLGKKCGRCSTRYCGAECQVQHWKEGGHDKLCKLIKKEGGAEQYNANNKYAEAVAVAVEKCADDTKGQTCYICTQALHWTTKEGHLRGSSSRGTAGFAHVSCLAEQAKILMAEAEENNLGAKALNARFRRWYACSLCEQEYHGVVYCALAWGCWKTHLGRPETNQIRGLAMSVLGNGLFAAKKYEDAMIVGEAELAMKRRLGDSESNILAVQGNLANTYSRIGRLEEAVRTERDVYSGRLRLYGEEHPETLRAVNNYASSLMRLHRYAEAKALARKTMPVMRRVLGEGNEIVLKMRGLYAKTLYEDSTATLDDLREAVTTLEDAGRTARRVYGGSHPLTAGIEAALRLARVALAARDGGVSAIRDAVEAMTPGDRVSTT